MEIIIQPDANSAALLVARIIADAVRGKPNLVLGLATGDTQVSVYSYLRQFFNEGSLDLAKVTTFNLDEYIGIPPTHPCSYRSFMQEHLFNHVNIPINHTNLPDGIADDIDKECLRYEAAINNAGGIDLQLLGLGQVGHIGFNEPLSALTSRTRAKSLTPTTRRQNAKFFGGEENVPSRAITVGVGTILDSRRCLMLVTGKAKAEILRRAVEGPVTAIISATALQLHPKCTVVVDEAAAGNLEFSDYYRWSFENEPEWKNYR